MEYTRNVCKTPRPGVKVMTSKTKVKYSATKRGIIRPSKEFRPLAFSDPKMIRHLA